MDYRRPNFSRSAEPAMPDELYAIGARYADRRGRAGAMASLGAEPFANLRGNMSRPVKVLYPGTSKLSGGLLTSLIRSPDLDPDYVQRFQHIAIIAQLADAILSVAQATGKCIVPLDFDPNEYTSPEDCSCDFCTRERRSGTKNKGISVTMSKGGEDNEIDEGKESLHPVNGESTGGWQKPDELDAANNLVAETEISTCLEESTMEGNGCTLGSHCHCWPPSNFTAPLQQMELQ